MLTLLPLVSPPSQVVVVVDEWLLLLFESSLFSVVVVVPLEPGWGSAVAAGWGELSASVGLELDVASVEAVCNCVPRELLSAKAAPPIASTATTATMAPITSGRLDFIGGASTSLI